VSAMALTLNAAQPSFADCRHRHVLQEGHLVGLLSSGRRTRAVTGVAPLFCSGSAISLSHRSLLMSLGRWRRDADIRQPSPQRFQPAGRARRDGLAFACPLEIAIVVHAENPRLES
jgi:hypothetical protein